MKIYLPQANVLCIQINFSLGCEGAFPTYSWNLPKTSFLFREVRELEGVFSPWPFIAEEAQIYSELNGFQNVQDIYNEELINAVKLRSLALFLRYKLELGDGRRNDLRVQMSSEAKMKQPSEAPPHHLGSGVFVFKRGKIVHQSSDQEMIVKLLEAEHCYSDIPVHPVKKYKFLFIANRMLIISSAKEPFHKLYMVSKNGSEQARSSGQSLRRRQRPRML